jgi:hypothetical protein
MAPSGSSHRHPPRPPKILTRSLKILTRRPYVRQGTAGDKIGAVLGAIKPEVVYFTDSGVGRGVLMIVDVDSAAQIPHVTEPLMLNFSASVHYRVAMSPEELQSAGLDRYATG